MFMIIQIQHNILSVYYITTMNTLERYFSDEYFLINKNGNNVIITDKSSNTICLELTIMPPYIKIELLNKCRNGLSGKKLLHIIREYAEERMDITHIELQDASLITNVCVNNSYRFSLADLYILSTGKSWYNSFGYKSNNYSNEISHNRKLLDMNIIDFIYLCNSKKYYPSSQEEMEEDITGFYSFFAMFYKKRESPLRLEPTMTVKETFTRIKKYYIKQLTGDTSETGNISCELFAWLFTLITDSDVILYNPSKLTLDLSKRNSLRNSSFRLEPYNSFIIRRHTTTQNNHSTRKSSKKNSKTRRRSY